MNAADLVRAGDARALFASHGPIEAVVFGGSAGSINVLLELLPGLPADLRVPVVGVVHVRAGHPSALPELFDPLTQVRVREAIDKQAVEPGVVLFAPSGCHLLVERDLTVSLSVDEPVLFSRPSIDVLFESAAWAWRECLLGLVLSGASADGAAGLAAIAAAGGMAWVQDPNTAEVGIMPKAALRAVPAARTLSIAAMRDGLALLSRSEPALQSRGPEAP